jgi:hypothetical protein
MIPERHRPDGTLEQRQPLGVEFLVGRWICEDYCLSRHTVPLTDSWIFAPSYRGPRPRPLVNAPAEAELVRSKFAGTTISPALFNTFEAAMQSGGRSLLHFVCHGSSSGAGAQAIIDEDNLDFSSTALGGAAATPKACAASKPFVFLNACEVGRTTPALIGVGGFAAAFIELGASCVVAPLWSVKDDIAHKVAEEFYNATLAKPGRPFAEILADIRARAYAAGDAEDTYAAYCFYGDPLASQT